MRDADKNRDPERARKRAVSDARCALRKLGLLEGLHGLEGLLADCEDREEKLDVSLAFVEKLSEALGVKS